MLSEVESEYPLVGRAIAEASCAIHCIDLRCLEPASPHLLFEMLNIQPDRFGLATERSLPLAMHDFAFRIFAIDFVVKLVAAIHRHCDRNLLMFGNSQRLQ